MDALCNTVGIIGMIMMLAAYFLQQQSGMASRHGLYLWLNLIGALAMILSLLHFWNLASFLLEVAWAGISFTSLIRMYRTHTPFLAMDENAK